MSAESFVELPQTKRRVVERFDQEAEIWNEIHSGEARDIIQWEIVRRKVFAREFIRQRFHDRPAAILEVGCGAGRNLEEILSGNADWRGKGVDVAPAMIDCCRVRYQKDRQLEFEVMDIETEYLRESFDVILLLGVVGYLDSNSAAFRNIQHMLRPGGHVILTFGKAYTLSRCCRSVMRFCFRTLRSVWIRFGRRKVLFPDQSGGSLFRCYTLSSVTRSFPPEWRVASKANIAFGSGILGRLSVRISQLLERAFKHVDPFRLALTSIIVAVNDKNVA
jgi:SAM-dependent methyltransferase